MCNKPWDLIKQVVITRIFLGKKLIGIHFNSYLKKSSSKNKIPTDWNSSINLSKKSLFLKETLGSELHKAFIAIKEMEYNKVASAVTELDIELYLDSI